jgi:gamma-glutamyltranspeptidase/glutathione hydrolase
MGGAISACDSLLRDWLPVPQIIGYYIKRNMAAFVAPRSGVEERPTQCTLRPRWQAPDEYEVFRNSDLAHT